MPKIVDVKKTVLENPAFTVGFRRDVATKLFMVNYITQVLKENPNAYMCPVCMSVSKGKGFPQCCHEWQKGSKLLETVKGELKTMHSTAMQVLRTKGN
jgi:hypothetical protein